MHGHRGLTISLKWRVFAFLLAISAMHIGLGVMGHKSLLEQSEAYATQQLHESGSSFEPLLLTVADNMVRLATQIAAGHDFSSQAAPGIAPEVQLRLAETAAFDSQGRQLFGDAYSAQIGDGSLSLEVLSTGKPLATISCPRDCRLRTWVPVIDRTGQERVVMLSQPLANVLQPFYAFEHTDTVLLGPSGAQAIDDLNVQGLPVVALSATGGFSQDLLEIVSSAPLPGDQQVEWFVAGGRHVLMMRQDIDLRLSDPVTAIFAIDMTAWRSAQTAQFNRAAIIGLAGLALTIALAMAFLSPSLGRLRRMTEALPKLAKREYQGARLLLGRPERSWARPMHEVEALRQSAHWLVNRLEELDSAEEANKAKTEFLAMVSHEIRTPLTGVLSTLELIDHAESDSERQMLLATVRESSESLKQIIDDTLDLSKIEARQIVLERVPTDLERLIEGVAAGLHATAQRKGLSMVLDLDPELRFPVLCDPLRVRQILFNLASNSLKFTERGSIYLRAQKRPDGKILFEVQDSGIGISPSQSASLFKPFTQADATISRRYGGTGLGLSISQGLVQRMGGTIQVQSKFGEGARFSFELELPPSDLNPDPSPDLFGLAVDLDRVIDPDIAAIITRLLEDAGATVASGAVIAMEPTADGNVICVRSQSRRNTTALVRMPLARSALIDAVARAAGRLLSMPTSGPARNSELAQRRSSYRWLAVEDHPVNRDLLRRQLGKLGFACDVAADGREALERLRLTRYDGVITDLQMPGISGLELTRTIRNSKRREESRLPILVLSAQVQQDGSQQALEAGASAYAVKPLPLEDLGKQLDQLLNLQPEISQPALVPDDLKVPAPIDLSMLAMWLGGDLSQAKEVLNSFCESNREPLTDLADAVSHADFMAIKRCAHKIKGSASAACAMTLVECLTALEEAAQRDDSRACVRAHKEALAAFAEVESYIDSLADAPSDQRPPLSLNQASKDGAGKAG